MFCILSPRQFLLNCLLSSFHTSFFLYVHSTRNILRLFFSIQLSSLIIVLCGFYVLTVFTFLINFFFIFYFFIFVILFCLYFIFVVLFCLYFIFVILFYAFAVFAFTGIA